MEELNLRFELWPKQLMAINTPATELLFGGASEGGKSHLIRVALITWCLAIEGLQCVLIRKKYDDILKNHVYGPTGFLALLSPLIQRKKAVVTQQDIKFANGSVIGFQHCQDERQFDSAQGVEKHVLVLDEAPQIGERLIRFFRAWVRMSNEMRDRLPEQLKGKFPRIIYTGNPVGPSIGFFRRNFVKARPAFAIEEVGGFKRQYIPSRAEDNRSVDLIAHKARLAEIGDEALAKALDEGDWDSPIGDFFREWDEERHVMPDFIPPAHWARYRTFDWGSAEPFAVYWFAVSDGETFKAQAWVVEDGILVKREKQFWFPRGARVVYREWYGCEKDDPSKGVGMENASIAKGILERSPETCEKDLITLTDSYPFPDRGETGGQTIAKTFRDNGCPLTLGDTSRVTGWSAMRDLLIGRKFDLNSPRRTPMLFLVQSCKYARDYIPALPRHPNEAKREDAAEHGEATHSCDALRLGCLATPRIKDAEPPAKHLGPKDLSNTETFDQVIKRARQVRERRNGTGY